ncbi:MAG: hypothetical protein Fur0010_06700 [Bdellovibrio sp.]
MHKFSSAIPLSGAKEFYESNFTLRNFNLDLSDWHGHQSIISLRPLSFPAIIETEVPLDSEMSIFLKSSHQKGSFFGVKINKDKVFEISGAEDFKYKNQILRMTRGQKSNTIRIENSKDNLISFWFNSTKVANFESEGSNFYLNVRGSLRSSIINSIKTGAQNYSFVPQFNLLFFAFFLVFSLILNILFQSEIILPLFLALFFLIIPLVGFDYFYMRFRIPETKLELKVESIRQSLISYFKKGHYSIEHKYFFPYYRILKTGFRFFERNWPSPFIHTGSGEIEFQFDKQLEGNNFLFLGGSQTYGVGATDLSRSFPLLYQKKINDEFNCHYNLYNISFPGANSQALLPHLKRVLGNSKFKAIFFNLVLNDFKQNGTETLLNFIYNYSLQNSIPLFIVREPLDQSATDGELLNLAHRRTDLFAKDKGVTLVDLHNHLNYQKMIGQLWWDKVHLTDYGNEVAAEYLWNQKLINSKCSFVPKDF